MYIKAKNKIIVLQITPLNKNNRIDYYYTKIFYAKLKNFKTKEKDKRNSKYINK